MSLQIYFVMTLLGCTLSQGRLLNSDSLLPRPATGKFTMYKILEYA